MLHTTSILTRAPPPMIYYHHSGLCLFSASASRSVSSYLCMGFLFFHRDIAFLHLPIFSWKHDASVGSDCHHPTLTVSYSPSFPSHRLSNLKPLRPPAFFYLIFTRTGRWSEPHLKDTPHPCGRTLGASPHSLMLSLSGIGLFRIFFFLTRRKNFPNGETQSFRRLRSYF